MVIFNRSTGNSYSDEDATLYHVNASGGTARTLNRANKGPYLRNSWARWSPFVQNYKKGKRFWFTFSSTRDYGNRLINQGPKATEKVPQLWMTAYYVDPAAPAGSDASFPAFWLPFQQLTTNNHIAQWTEKVVSVQ